MGIKRIFNSVFQATHYRLVDKNNYERIYACKDANVSAADSVGHSIVADLPRLLPPDDSLSIFDVGANKGAMYRLFRSLYPQSQIYCFEPDLRAYQKLLKITENDPLAHCEMLAVSDKNERIDFNIADDSPLNSILTPLSVNLATMRPDNFIEKIKVDSVSLDSYVQQHGLDRIDLLKMDIQGAEIHALTGASQLLREFKIGCIYLEIVFSAGYVGQPLAAEIIDYLHYRSYDLCGFYNLRYLQNDTDIGRGCLTHSTHYSMGSNLLSYCDALFIPNIRKKLIS